MPRSLVQYRGFAGLPGVVEKPKKFADRLKKWLAREDTQGAERGATNKTGANLGKVDEAILAYTETAHRYSTSSDLTLRVGACRALFDMAVSLGDLGRDADAIALYDDLLARFSAATELALRELVANALVNKGGDLWALGRHEEAMAVYDDVLARFENATEPSLRDIAAGAKARKAASD